MRNSDLDLRERISFESALHVLGSGCVLYTTGFAVSISTVNQTKFEKFINCAGFLCPQYCIKCLDCNVFPSCLTKASALVKDPACYFTEISMMCLVIVNVILVKTQTNQLEHRINIYADVM